MSRTALNLSIDFRSGGVSEVWSIKPVHKSKEITISYISPFETSTWRIPEYLQSQHNFTDQCSRCQTSTERGILLKEVEDLVKGKRTDAIKRYEENLARLTQKENEDMEREGQAQE